MGVSLCLTLFHVGPLAIEAVIAAGLASVWFLNRRDKGSELRIARWQQPLFNGLAVVIVGVIVDLCISTAACFLFAFIYAVAFEAYLDRLDRRQNFWTFRRE